MKVIIATPYYAPKLGGLELYAQHMAEQLAALGWDVHILTSGKSDSLTYDGKITVHRLPVMFTISNTPVNPLWIIQARRLIKQLQPDVINVHAPVPSMALAVSLASGKTPLVVTYHAGSMKKGKFLPDVLIAIYENVFLRLMLTRSTAIICASEFVRGEFLAAWSERSTTITPGVDSQKFCPEPHNRVAGRVLFIGDFRDPRKGLNYLLDAIGITPQASLRVVGQGSAVAASRVEYLGVLTGKSLVAEIQSASLLVLPSVTNAESFGMVLIEAMACGVPVIGSDIGGIAYVINDGVNGVLVPASNATKLATAIKRILEDSAYAAALVKTAHQDAVNNYSWTKRGLATAEVLKNATLPEVNRG